MPRFIVPVFGEPSICCKELPTNTAKRFGRCNYSMGPHVLVPAGHKESSEERLLVTFRQQ